MTMSPSSVCMTTRVVACAEAAAGARTRAIRASKNRGSMGALSEAGRRQPSSCLDWARERDLGGLGHDPLEAFDEGRPVGHEIAQSDAVEVREERVERAAER